ncbi:MAG: SRPBCC domain-containing protein [Gemmatimonadota bacterium]|nr:SRPBCC domain-containing protein [Gemmatimonadota bacterium]
MSTQTDTSLRITRIIKADRERVFRAWTDPKDMKQWSCPESAVVDQVDVDLRVGGRYRIRMKGEQEVWTAVGEYRTVDPPKKLVYSWDWEEKKHQVGETLVTVELNDLGGSTEVVLTHERFPSAEATKSHTEGWTSCLNRLESLFA